MTTTRVELRDGSDSFSQLAFKVRGFVELRTIRQFIVVCYIFEMLRIGQDQDGNYKNECC